MGVAAFWRAPSPPMAGCHCGACARSARLTKARRWRSRQILRVFSMDTWPCSPARRANVAQATLEGVLCMLRFVALGSSRRLPGLDACARQCGVGALVPFTPSAQMVHGERAVREGRRSWRSTSADDFSLAPTISWFRSRDVTSPGARHRFAEARRFDGSSPQLLHEPARAGTPRAWLALIRCRILCDARRGDGCAVPERTLLASRCRPTFGRSHQPQGNRK